jgi:hypothetical protein
MRTIVMLDEQGGKNNQTIRKKKQHQPKIINMSLTHKYKFIFLEKQKLNK